MKQSSIAGPRDAPGVPDRRPALRRRDGAGGAGFNQVRLLRRHDPKAVDPFPRLSGPRICVSRSESWFHRLSSDGVSHTEVEKGSRTPRERVCKSRRDLWTRGGTRLPEYGTSKRLCIAAMYLEPRK